MKKKQKLNCEEARNFPIEKALEKLGHFPNRRKEKEAWFLSPFRSEKTASFKVDLKINRWYDHGKGTGGNIIDLITLLKNCSIYEALSFLSDDITAFSFHQQPKTYIKLKSERSYEIMKVKSLNNEALLEYLRFRKINTEIAKLYCKEIYYKQNDKNYFAIAFENKSSGQEIRNKYYKGSLGTKDITLIKNGANRVTVFEGFIDFLTHLSFINELNEDYLVLNSTALVNKSIAFLNKYESVICYLDNDEAGEKATQIIKENCKNKFEDGSALYKNCKDLNEFNMNNN